MNVKCFNTNRSVELHFWNQGYGCAAEIARLTKIPIHTVQYNIAKIEEQDTVEQQGGNDRPCKITPSDSRVIGQWIRRNSETTTKGIAAKLREEIGRHVSKWMVRRHLAQLGYKNILPRATPMLTQKQKERRVQWALQHKDDDWRGTVFSIETSYQLLRNAICHLVQEGSSRV